MLPVSEDNRANLKQYSTFWASSRVLCWIEGSSTLQPKHRVMTQENESIQITAGWGVTSRVDM